MATRAEAAAILESIADRLSALRTEMAGLEPETAMLDLEAAATRDTMADLTRIQVRTCQIAESLQRIQLPIK